MGRLVPDGIVSETVRAECGTGCSLIVKNRLGPYRVPVRSARMNQTATLVESRAVHPTRGKSFHQWTKDYLHAIEQAPGHGGTMRLEQSGGLNHLVSQFENEAALDGWRRSDVYRKLREDSAPFSAGLAQHGSGKELCFAIPSESTARKWKRFLVVWGCVLPILLVLNTTVRTLLPGLPPLVQLCITSPILTALLTWVVLPRIQRWSSYWMLQGADGKLRREPD